MSVVLVTGAASGLGLEIAAAFLRNGAVVHVCDSSATAISDAIARYPSITATFADVADYGALQTVFEEADRLGPLDVLVNNAGISGPAAPSEEVEQQAWDRTLAVNLSGAFFACQHAIRRMKVRQAGTIINISTATVRTGLPGRTAYVVSKQGLMGLTQNLARELGPHGIRVNAILPGLIANERGRALVQAHARRTEQTPAAAEQEMLRFISMRSWIAPAEIADVAVFLASPAARHITGQFLGVCGGVEWEG